MSQAIKKVACNQQPCIYLAAFVTMLMIFKICFSGSFGGEGACQHHVFSWPTVALAIRKISDLLREATTLPLLRSRPLTNRQVIDSARLYKREIHSEYTKKSICTRHNTYVNLSIRTFTKAHLKPYYGAQQS